MSKQVKNLLQLQVKSENEFNIGNVLKYEVNLNRNWDWSNMVTLNDNMRQVLFWLYTDKVLSPVQPDTKTLMSQANNDNHVHRAKACEFKMSACGNFVVVAYSNNLVIKYNMQSGREYGVIESKEFNSKLESKKSNSTILKIYIDRLLKILQVFTSTSDVMYFGFSKMKFLSKRS